MTLNRYSEGYKEGQRDLSQYVNGIIEEIEYCIRDKISDLEEYELISEDLVEFLKDIIVQIEKCKYGDKE